MATAALAIRDRRSVAGVRRSIGGAIFERIAGPDGAEVRAPAARGPDAERWFEPGSPITRVHGDASMFIGGLSALLLQSLHPLAMAGVDRALRLPRRPVGPARPHQPLPRRDHVRRRPPTPSGQIAAVRAVHRRVAGVAPDGRPYAASDPHLLAWVHVCEVDSFLRALPALRRRAR